jgi:hypothetical protein
VRRQVVTVQHGQAISQPTESSPLLLLPRPQTAGLSGDDIPADRT